MPLATGCRWLFEIVARNSGADLSMFECRSLIFRGFWCLSVMDLRGITCDIFGRSVLSDTYILVYSERGINGLSSQCTFWRSVLSDQVRDSCKPSPRQCLNAPFGARCFLTRDHNHRGIVGPMGLNAPFGARCFLTTAP